MTLVWIVCKTALSKKGSWNPAGSAILLASIALWATATTFEGSQNSGRVLAILFLITALSIVKGLEISLDPSKFIRK